MPISPKGGEGCILGPNERKKKWNAVINRINNDAIITMRQTAELRINEYLNGDLKVNERCLPYFVNYIDILNNFSEDDEDKVNNGIYARRAASVISMIRSKLDQGLYKDVEIMEEYVSNILKRIPKNECNDLFSVIRFAFKKLLESEETMRAS